MIWNLKTSPKHSLYRLDISSTCSCNWFCPIHDHKLKRWDWLPQDIWPAWGSVQVSFCFHKFQMYGSSPSMAQNTCRKTCRTERGLASILYCLANPDQSMLGSNLWSDTIKGNCPSMPVLDLPGLCLLEPKLIDLSWSMAWRTIQPRGCQAWNVLQRP